MARVYIVTEEEMNSLIDQLELESLREQNLIRPYKPTPTIDEMHRKFHYVVVRWAQAMGFEGRRA